MTLTPEENYVPYGDEWVNQMKKLPKDFLISMLKKNLIELKEEREMAAKMREALEGIIKSWDSRSHEIEVKKYLTVGGDTVEYWSPVASLVDSEKIAAAREALNNYK